jgi:hypothetical protein
VFKVYADVLRFFKLAHLINILGITLHDRK